MLGSVGFFDNKSFSHQRIGMSPPPPGGGVVGVDVGMGSFRRGPLLEIKHSYHSNSYVAFLLFFLFVVLVDHGAWRK